jgi:beta-glucosidase
MKTLFFAIFLIFASTQLHSQSKSEAEAYVDNLVSQMTIDEKILQLHAGEAPEIERLGIPQYVWHNECLHGVVIRNATVFPQSIAIAATFNDSLMFRISSAISTEARVLYNQGRIGVNFWSPNINIFRDPRWGRGQETYGEDPFLTGRMSMQFIHGLQGDDPFYLKTIASPKHFNVHSGPEVIRHEFNAVVGEADLWETYMPAFKKSIVEAKAYSIMSSYNSVNGIPPTASKALLTDLLRNEWGFEGYVVSDCGAVSDVVWGHNYVSTTDEAVAASLKAGCDLECGTYYKSNLRSAYDNGLITEADLDLAVTRLMMARYKLGQFTDDSPFQEYNDSLLECHAHIELAIQAARETIVLLENKDDLLPLRKDLNKILVVGPLAKDEWEYRGSYSGHTSYKKKFYDAMKERFPETEFEFDRATEIVGSLTELLDYTNVKTPDGKPGFLGMYFNNMDFEGEPHYSQIDPTINFDWDEEKPNEKTNKDTFSIRWLGKLKVDNTAEYTFKVTSDEGSRLYINDSLIINDWNIHYAVARLAFFKLTAGVEYDIRLDYFDERYFASCKLEMGYSGTGSKQLGELATKAKDFDAVIYVGGITSFYESEERNFDVPGFYYGDRTSLKLPTAQEKVIKALYESGTPLVSIIMSGSCISSDWLHANTDAVIQSFYGGQGIADALTDVIFGDYSPSGHLPVTFYKSVDDLPDFEDYSMLGRTYRYYSGDVLYPFGYGQSYCDFEIENFELTSKEFDVDKHDEIPYIFEITNNSEVAGSDVIQVYARQIKGSNRANWELIDYTKIPLVGKELKTISSSLEIDELSCYNKRYSTMLVEPGLYEIGIGYDSRSIIYKDTVKIHNDNVAVGGDEETATVYPNPSQTNVTIKLDNDSVGITSVVLFDFSGRKISANGRVEVGNSSIEVLVTDLSSGFYYIEIRKNGTIQRENFVISR